MDIDESIEVQSDVLSEVTNSTLTLAKKSFAWNYFKILGRKATCKECTTQEVTIAASTYNLKRHLMRHHREAFKKVKQEDSENDLIKPSKPQLVKARVKAVKRKFSSRSVSTPAKSQPPSENDVKIEPNDTIQPEQDEEPFQATIQQLRVEVAALKTEVQDCRRQTLIDLADYKAQLVESKREMEVIKAQLKAQSDISTRIEITPVVTRYTIHGVTGEVKQQPSSNGI